MHEAHGSAVSGGPAVKVDSLNQRTGTVADSNDGDSDFSHGKGNPTRSLGPEARCNVAGLQH